jgi:predicted MPP superfamily phosphohydrolase
MPAVPLANIVFERGRHFHNSLVLLNRADSIPRIFHVIAAGEFIYGATLAWPDFKIPVAAVLAVVLSIEWGVIWWGNRTGKSPSPLGGPFFLFTFTHNFFAAGCGLLPLPPAWSFAVFLVIQAALLGSMIYASLVEPFKVGWREVEVRLDPGHDQDAGPGQGQGTSLIKILLISDLHLDRWGDREEKVLEMARKFEPDLVLWPGDFTNLSFVGDEVTLKQTREFILELCALAPVYASRGTREVDDKEWMDALKKDTCLRLLDNQGLEVKLSGLPLYIIGVPYAGESEDMARNIGELAASSQGRPVILLLHSPDLIEEASRLGVDLYLCGHTHGGQIRLPVFGAPYTASRYRNKYAWGAFKVGKTTMVVSRGIGMEGAGSPRLRFLCPPEVVGIKLRV